MIAVPPKERPNTQPIKYPTDIRRQYAEWYIDRFKKTPLLFMTDDDEVLKIAVGEEGQARVGLRRDGVGSPWHAGRWMNTPPYNTTPKLAEVWKERPIWFEFFGTGQVSAARRTPAALADYNRQANDVFPHRAVCRERRVVSDRVIRRIDPGVGTGDL